MNRPNPRTAAMCLNGLAGVVVLFGFGVSLRMVTQTTEWSPPTVMSTPTSKPSASSDKSNSVDLAVIAKRNLRQTLIDAPAAPSSPPPPPASLTFRLVGTILDGDSPFAIFDRGSSGAVLRQRGEVLDGFEVREIRSGRATLYRGSTAFELELPKEPAPKILPEP